MEYLSARQTAEKWKISVRLVQQYCAEGRIQGAEKKGTAWVVPENAEKPTDPRKKERGQDSFQSYAVDEHTFLSRQMYGLSAKYEERP